MDVPMSPVAWIMLFFMFLLLFLCVCAASLQKRLYYKTEDASRMTMESDTGDYRQCVLMATSRSRRSAGDRLVPFQMSAMQACIWSHRREDIVLRRPGQEDQQPGLVLAKVEEQPPSYETLFGNKEQQPRPESS